MKTEGNDMQFELKAVQVGSRESSGDTDHGGGGETSVEANNDQELLGNDPPSLSGEAADSISYTGEYSRKLVFLIVGGITLYVAIVAIIVVILSVSLQTAKPNSTTTQATISNMTITHDNGATTGPPTEVTTTTILTEKNTVQTQTSITPSSTTLNGTFVTESIKTADKEYERFQVLLSKFATTTTKNLLQTNKANQKVDSKVVTFNGSFSVLRSFVKDDILAESCLPRRREGLGSKSVTNLETSTTMERTSTTSKTRKRRSFSWDNTSRRQGMLNRLQNCTFDPTSTVVEGGGEIFHVPSDNEHKMGGCQIVTNHEDMTIIVSLKDRDGQAGVFVLSPLQFTFNLIHSFPTLILVVSHDMNLKIFMTSNVEITVVEDGACVVDSMTQEQHKMRPLGIISSINDVCPLLLKIGVARFSRKQYQNGIKCFRVGRRRPRNSCIRVGLNLQKGVTTKAQFVERSSILSVYMRRLDLNEKSGNSSSLFNYQEINSNHVFTLGDITDSGVEFLLNVDRERFTSTSLCFLAPWTY